MFEDCPGKAGDRGGDLGERGDSVGRALREPMLGDCGASLLEVLVRFRGGTFEALDILAKRGYPVGRAAGCRYASSRAMLPDAEGPGVGLCQDLSDSSLPDSLSYHCTVAARSFRLQPCRVRRSSGFRLLIRLFVVVPPALLSPLICCSAPTRRRECTLASDARGRENQIAVSGGHCRRSRVRVGKECR